MKEECLYKVYDLTGVVQGVGLRATIRWYANQAGLGGWVQNRAGLVRMRLEGSASQIAAFVRELPAHLPARARIDRISEVASGSLPEGTPPESFQILSSSWFS